MLDARRWLAGLAAAVLVLGGGFAWAGPDDDEKAAKDKIEEYKKKLKEAKDEDGIIEAVNVFDGCTHKLICKELIKFLAGARSSSTLSAGLDIYVKTGDPAASKSIIGLMGRYKSSKEEDAACLVALLAALAQLKDPTTVSTLSKYASDNNPDVAEEAIGALGEIGDPNVVETLIGIFREGERAAQDPNNPNPPQPGQPGYYSDNPKEKLREPVREAVKKITGKSVKDDDDFMKWWRDHKKEVFQKWNEKMKERAEEGKD